MTISAWLLMNAGSGGNCDLCMGGEGMRGESKIKQQTAGNMIFFGVSGLVLVLFILIIYYSYYIFSK